MTEIKIYVDEDVHGLIAKALRLRGWDVLTTLEAGKTAATDEDQLRFASEKGLAILSYNVADFPRLHYEFLERGEDHAGIIVARQMDASRNVQPLFNLLSHVSADEMRNQLVFLTNWA